MFRNQLKEKESLGKGNTEEDSSLINSEYIEENVEKTEILEEVAQNHQIKENDKTSEEYIKMAKETMPNISITESDNILGKEEKSLSKELEDLLKIEKEESDRAKKLNETSSHDESQKWLSNELIENREECSIYDSLISMQSSEKENLEEKETSLLQEDEEEIKEKYKAEEAYITMPTTNLVTVICNDNQNQILTAEKNAAEENQILNNETKISEDLIKNLVRELLNDVVQRVIESIINDKKVISEEVEDALHNNSNETEKILSATKNIQWMRTSHENTEIVSNALLDPEVEQIKEQPVDEDLSDGEKFISNQFIDMELSKACREFEKKEDNYYLPKLENEERDNVEAERQNVEEQGHEEQEKCSVQIYRKNVTSTLELQLVTEDTLEENNEVTNNP